MISANTIIGGRYRVTRPIGGGGMKQVYLAEDLRLAARSCALAEMVDSFTNPDMQRSAVAAFQREADMLAELNHEHIPRIYDRFSEQNRHYLVMEYVKGTTLEEKIKAAGGRLAEAEVTDIALQVLDTLDYLHHLSPPVVYRDLKPSNVMVTESGQLKLIDFGIARHFQPQTNATMIGTQGYAPPEQYRGKVEARSDLYALGATMHHALSGRDPTTEPPFSFPPLKKLCPKVNPALADLVGDALSYDVESRVPSAGEFKRRLLAIKIEALTNGLVDQADAAVTLGGLPSATVKQPLRSPNLPTSSAPAVSSPSAPTVLTAADEVSCPKCSKFIPADSRFCSYCAADLRRLLGPGQVVANPQAETVRLPDATEVPVLHPSFGRERRWLRRHRRMMRGPSLLVLFLAAFAAVRLIPYLAMMLGSLSGTEPGEGPGHYAAPDPGYSERYSEPGYGTVPPESGSPRSEPSYRSPRAAALRRTLDEMGYTAVRFRLSGDSLELWGTVPSEADRLMVETTAFSVTGAVTLNDHIEVGDRFAAP